MSKLDPQLLRTLLASGCPSCADEGCGANYSSRCPLPTPTRSATPAYPLPPPTPPAMEIRQQLPSPLPVMTRASASAVGIPTEELSGVGGPMTIFYNETVSVFDLPIDRAEAIINWVESTNPGVQQMMERAAGTLADDGSQQQQQQRPAMLLDKLGGEGKRRIRKGEGGQKRRVQEEKLVPQRHIVTPSRFTDYSCFSCRPCNTRLLLTVLHQTTPPQSQAEDPFSAKKSQEPVSNERSVFLLIKGCSWMI